MKSNLPISLRACSYGIAKSMHSNFLYTGYVAMGYENLYIEIATEQQQIDIGRMYEALEEKLSRYAAFYDKNERTRFINEILLEMQK